MATEAQRLIGISLTKIAQSRTHRGGVSLHKNLLVATVLQKARYIFMEEAYHMVHAGGYCPAPRHDYHHQQQHAEDELVALTPEEAGITDSPTLDSIESTVESTLQDFLEPSSCVRCSDDVVVDDDGEDDIPSTETSRDKENVPPPCYQGAATPELTYLDLDKTAGPLRERASQPEPSSTCLKRRRAVAEWEIEEAVLSILPKRGRLETSDEVGVTPEDDDSVFLDEAALFSESVAREVTTHQETQSSAMEIDRITSLVSIFSFGNLTGGDGIGKLARSVSTPDLCSAQAKEAVDALQQRPFIAMTV